MTAGQIFIRGLWKENPIFRLVLGMCPTLAVTTSVFNGLGMGLASTFVLICSNAIIALLRGFIPKKVRIPAFIVVIATFVTIVDRLLAAYLYQMSKALGPYIPLIIVNCIIICRCEVCASRQSVPAAAADALGQSLGFGLALAGIAAVRELLGTGQLAGLQVLPAGWPPWVIMVLPPGAFLTFGLLLALVNWTAAARARANKGGREK